ncbi:MAG TPA: NifB/NifX family molybdenum-iron cluster-binding protein, partial [Pseudomonas sp.]|nr:NifB/NifX family molybdenum-iron cluster-binding protein [Pseudomonas sp.]
RDGEFEDSVRIACASDSGERLDGSFASCARFLIYQISPRASRLIDVRVPPAAGEDDDRHARRAELLADCQLLYTLSIGGPAAAKVIRAGVHPIKLAGAQPAREIVEELQRVLATTPPPWLAKAMGADPDRRVRFTSNDSP